MILVVAKHDLKGTKLIDVKPRNWLNTQGATGKGDANVVSTHIIVGWGF